MKAHSKGYLSNLFEKERSSQFGFPNNSTTEVEEHRRRQTLAEEETGFIYSQRDLNRQRSAVDTQHSAGEEIEKTFEHSSFIRPPGFVQASDEHSVVLNTTKTIEDIDTSREKSTDHECHAGTVSSSK